MLFKLSIVLVVAVGAVLAQNTEESCKAKVDLHCNKDNKATTSTAAKPCSPIYGAIKNNEVWLREYINEHIGNSFEYLLQWANFHNYKKDREGFAKLYRKLSDDTWEDSIKLVKYLGKRGVELDFADMIPKPNGTEKYGVGPDKGSSDTEIASLAKVLDLHKHLAISGNKLHGHSLKRDADIGIGTDPKHMEHHDMELAHFIEEEFSKKHAQTVRDLAGHSDDLYRLLKEGGTDLPKPNGKNTDNRGLNVYLFDQYLSKLY